MYYNYFKQEFNHRYCNFKIYRKLTVSLVE